MKNFKYLIICFISCALSFAVFSQETTQQPGQTHVVYLKDGSTVHGKMVSENDTEIKLQTSNMGEVIIKKSEITKTEILQDEKFKKGKYWFPNPNSTRYLFGPTGRNMKKGSGYYQNIDIFFNSLHYGFTDWFSIGAGFEAISTFSGHPVFMIMPKVGFNITDKFSAGGGIFYINANLASEGDELLDANFSGGLAYGVVTYGTEDLNGSLGAGWAFSGEGDFSNEPIITVSGMGRVSRRIAIVTENWFVSKGFLLTYGVRFLSERMSFDWALINNDEIMKTFPIGLPFWLSANFNF